ncbi:signal recognition particle-docking protein FtsY [Methanococcus voltae]|uniref:Signal recognition particle receptor FtsY n=2 Tax=Methanococcus voltae TaxID=2188 RepID=A0A8J7RLQ9_METVO|nr:signal recognition particle-docking protein FtsY [Methanococcus voltae]MBP2171919.1 fused signal recognition particle receptor [Methanococcus voltae]MBP2201126.1 fused signal recognition particle receptor [Methanococcus voltae]MCS3921849.1 fused signal recognition particle receptor [Methanococcus voltae PS]
MFGSLKSKLTDTMNKLSNKIYKKGEAVDEEINEEIKEIKTELTKVNENPKIDEKEELEENVLGKFEKTKVGFLDKFKITKSIKKVLSKEVVLTEDDIEEILEELELELLEADVAYDTVESIIESLKENLIGLKITSDDKPEEIIENALKSSIRNILAQEKIDIEQLIQNKNKEGEPAIIIFLGINGTGKTTSISKLAYKLKENGHSVVMAAGDTFRAGAIDQLEEHANNLEVKVIKHQKGADSAAVIFDAIQHAKAKKIDVVLADTAGRQTTNINLMSEIKKVVRVTKPDLVVFVGDSLAGNDAITQAEEFNNAVTIDGAILTKTDADAKGGAALSIAHSIGKPILYMGVGQRYSDLQEFDVDWMVNKLFSENEEKLSVEREF